MGVGKDPDDSLAVGAMFVGSWPMQEEKEKKTNQQAKLARVAHPDT